MGVPRKKRDSFFYARMDPADRDLFLSFISHAGRVIIAPMKLQYIRLSEALEQMDQLDEFGKPARFQIKFVTANRNLGTGGEIIEIKNGRKCVGTRKGKVVFDMRKADARTTPPPIPKDPHHWANSTRNILLPNGQIRKVHIRLIIEFNGKKVCF